MARRRVHDLRNYSDAQLEHIWNNPVYVKRTGHPTLKFLRLSDAVLAEQIRRRKAAMRERLAPIWNDANAIRAVFIETGCDVAFDRLTELQGA